MEKRDKVEKEEEEAQTGSAGSTSLNFSKNLKKKKKSWMKVQAGNAGFTSKLLRQDIGRIPTESSETMLFSKRFLTNREAYQYDVCLEFRKYERHYT